MGKYKDYAKITFSDNEVSYRIGKNSGIFFVANSVVFLASEECYVKFDNFVGGASSIPIPKGDYFGWDGPISVISVVRKIKNGTLEVWSEGHIQNVSWSIKFT